MTPSGPTSQTQLGSTQRNTGSAAADVMSYGDGDDISDREPSEALEMEAPLTQQNLGPWHTPNPPPPTKTEPVARTQRHQAAQPSDTRLDQLLTRIDRLERAMTTLVAAKTPTPPHPPPNPGRKVRTYRPRAPS